MLNMSVDNRVGMIFPMRRPFVGDQKDNKNPGTAGVFVCRADLFVFIGVGGKAAIRLPTPAEAGIRRSEAGAAMNN